MKLSIKKVMAGLLIVPMMALGLTAVLPTNAMALDCVNGQTKDGIDCVDPGTNPELFGAGGIVTNIINAALFIIGAVSVVMIIYGGVRYTISAGNANAVTAAKNTILYAVIGLIVAIAAYAIVDFTIGQFTT